MYLKYGSFQHPDNLVNLLSFNQRSVYNSRGRLQITRKTMQLQVTLLAVGGDADAMQDSLKSQMQALETAYSANGKDAGLYHDDGGVTPHFLDSSQSLGGVRVMSLDYPKSDGAEYATQRTLNITLEADFRSANSIVSFQETLRFNGTAGPKYAWVQVLNGPPQKQLIQQKTTQTITQSGSAVGFLSYISYPSPLFPRLEHQDRRSQTTGPPRLDNHRYVDWPTAWSYIFESPVSITAQPNRR